MAISLSTIVDALDANLNQLYLDGLNSWDEQYSVIFNIETSDNATEQDSYLSGFPIMPEKEEGVAASYASLIAGIKKTYTHKTYALGYEITEEAVEDNQRTGETFDKLPAALSRSAIETVEVSAATVINNGFSSTGYDGQYLFDTDHVNLDNSTWANTPSTQADLSLTSLSAALTAIDQYEDERGLKRPTVGKILAVPSAGWMIAEELLSSEFKPYTANNEVNALQRKELQYLVWKYLSDSDSWFVFAEKGQHMLKFIWRVRPGALRKGNDFDTTNLKHLSRMRFSCGYSHAMGTYGSSGA